MTKARLDGLYLMLLGSVVFLLLGGVLEQGAATKLVDFRVVYYPARCLLQHADPYMESEVLRVYRAEGADSPNDSEKVRQIVTRYFYLPTAFSFTIPFAMLPWWLAASVWMTITIGSFLFAAFLIWNLGADLSPVLSGVMVGFFLANSELLIVTGNAAAIAISFSLIAIWCFVRDRFVLAGILCIAVGLALKPHDTGLVWLYLMLAGGVYRRRALQSLVATVALSLPAVLWVWHVSPHWMQELNANIAAFAAHGGINDPGVASTGAHGLDMLISLQAVTGMFWDNPLVYNPVSLFGVRAASSGMGICNFAIEAHAKECMARTRGNRGSDHAACLSSAKRCQASAAHRSRMRHAMGRGRRYRLARGAGQ
jgi:hypothetical protein